MRQYHPNNTYVSVVQTLEIEFKHSYKRKSIENVVCKTLATSYDLKVNRAIVQKQNKNKNKKKLPSF